MCHRATTVDLDREYADLPSNDRLSDVWVRELARFGDTLTRLDRLNGRFTIVLGEAGTGKSVELRQARRAFGGQGAAVVLTNSATLARRGDGTALGLDDRRELDRARDPEVPCWLLIDALDEAKVAGFGFNDVLLALENAVPIEILQRSRFVFTSRPSEWTSSDDLTLQTAKARLEIDEPQTRILQILPLDSERIACLAMALGVDDIDRFMHEVETAGFSELAGRPVEVEMLVDLWNQEGRLGSLSEVLEASLTRNLTAAGVGETTLRLSSEQARAGAGKLAALAALSGRRSFSLGQQGTGTLATALPAWEPSHHRELLLCPIFNESVSNAVRLRSETLQHYLAAEWLQNQTTDGALTQGRLLSLLFRDEGGQIRVPQHLSSIAAWLAIRNAAVRDRLTTCGPQHLLDEGDPSALPMPTRRDVIQRFVERFGDRERIGMHFGRAGLRRFSDTLLAETIAPLLAGECGDDSKALLFELVAEGEIAELQTTALEAACSPETPLFTRVAATEAAAILCDAASRPPLQALLVEDAVPLEVAAALVRNLYPATLSGADLAALILHVCSRTSWNSVTAFDNALRAALHDTALADDRVALINALQTASASDDGWGSHHLAAALAHHVSVTDDPLADPSIREIVGGLMTGDEFRHYRQSTLDPITAAVESLPDIRREMLRIYSERLESFWQANFFSVPGVGRPSIEDLEWLVGVASGDSLPVIQRALTALQNPNTTPAPALEAQPTAVSAATIATLRQHSEQLRAGHAGALDFAIRSFEGSEQLGALDFSRFEDAYPDDVVGAVYAGLREHLMSYEPPENPDYRSIPLGVVLSLVAALRCFSTRSAIDEQLARRLVQLSIWEMNGFPPWFETLAGAHPNAVNASLIEALELELEPDCEHQQVLHKIGGAPTAQREVLSSFIAERLLDPGVRPTREALVSALRTLLCGDLSAGEEGWPEVCDQRLGDEEDDRAYAAWWITELRVAPEAADARFRTLVDDGQDGRRGEIVDLLWRWVDRGDGDVSDVVRSESLGTLYGVLRELTDADNDHTAANRLLSSLVGEVHRQPSADEFFDEFANRQGAPWLELRSFHLHHRDRAVAAQPSMAPMRWQDALDWCCHAEASCRSDQGLFDLVLGHLDDLNLFLSEGRFSYRELFTNTVPHERLFQLWTASRLELASRSRYAVIREEELAEQTRPDITCYAPGPRAPTSLELKVATRWRRYEDLLERLRNQLVGQYMGAVRSAFGIYVICFTDPDQRWTFGERSLAPGELLEELRREARAICHQRSDIRELAVVGLYFASATR